MCPGISLEAGLNCCMLKYSETAKCQNVIHRKETATVLLFSTNNSHGLKQEEVDKEEFD